MESKSNYNEERFDSFLNKTIILSSRTYFKKQMNIIDKERLMINDMDYSAILDDFVTLNHEIFHCTIFILKRIGVSLSDDSEEAYAYLYEYITKMIYSKTAKFSSSSSR